MPNLWLCGITQNQLKNIDELTLPVYELVDGLVWTDHYSNDGTFELLYNRSGKGCIIQQPWCCAHDYSMNAILLKGPIKHGDWILMVDSQERVHPDFINKLKSVMLHNFDKQNIDMVYQRSKPILIKYTDDIIFQGSPHWGVASTRMRNIVKINEFNGFEDDKTYLWSLRDDINKWIVNGIKYYFQYGRSNHMWLIYGKQGEQKIYLQEMTRHAFRDYCRHELKMPLNMDGLNAYLDEGKYTDKFLDFMNKEKVIANYYRYRILKEEQQYIYETQDKWRLFNEKTT